MVEKQKRPQWDNIWMKFATLIAGRSIDPRFKVGAVIVATDNTQVLALGYNGDHAGGPNCIDSPEPGESGMIHAEINALIKMDYNCAKGKRMYVTLSPCIMCAKAIINAGIDEVIYFEEYKDSNGLDILKEAGILVKAYMGE